MAIAGYAMAQNLGDEPRQSKYTYIYRINHALALDIVTAETVQPFAPTQFACVDSFLTDTVYNGNLPYGFYMYVWANNNELTLQYQPQTDIICEVLDDWSCNKLVVRNMQGQYIDNAQVWYGKKTIPYNNRAKAYVFSAEQRNLPLTIACNSDTTIYLLKSSKTKHIGRHYLPARYVAYMAFYPFSRLYSAIDKAIKKGRSRQGYIVFSKPVYKHHDTVKLKAFVTNGYGRPVRKPLDIWLESYTNYNDQKLAAKLKPVSPGAYVYQFIAADSLLLDKHYTIKLKKREYSKYEVSGSFKLEDYLLDVATYTAQAEKEKVTQSDTITINFSGKDYNGLPVQDAEVKVVGLAKKIDRFFADSVYVPDTLFVANIQLNNNGTETYRLPCTQLPYGAITIKLNVQFKNSNNEVKDTSFIIEYTSPGHEIICTGTADSIYATYTINGKPVAGSGMVMVHSQNKLLYKKPIALPYSCKKDEFVFYYEFTADSGETRQFYYPDHDNLTGHAKRSDSTITFAIVNPQKIPVYYSIYRNKQLLESGCDTALQKSITDKSNAAYILNLHWVWKGEKYHRTVRSDANRYQTHININSADAVTPGQTDTIAITITGKKGQPLKNVNLTAYSVNAQFADDIELPRVPDYNRHKLLRKKRHTGYLNRTTPPKATYPLYIYTNWYHALRLNNLAYYQMLYPAGRQVVYYDSTAYHTPQFAPYIFDKGKQVKIHLIQYNNQPVYSAENNANTPYSFESVYKQHPRLELRTANYTFYIDTLPLVIGKKLEISYNYDSLLAGRHTKHDDNKYTGYEQNLLNNRLIAIRNTSANSTNNIYLLQGCRAFTVSKNNYSVVGPLLNDSATYYVPNRYTLKFMPEYGYKYNFSPGIMRLVENKLYLDKVRLDMYERNVKAFGEILTCIDVNTTPVEYQQPRYINSYNYSYSKEHNTGQLRLSIPDSAIEHIHLYTEDSSNYNSFYSGADRLNLKLPAGVYKAELFTKNGYYAVIGPFRVYSHGINYYRINNVQYYKLLSAIQLLNLPTGYNSANDTVQYINYTTIPPTQQRIAGLMKRIDGSIRAHAAVSLRNSKGYTISTYTDNNGEFAFGNLADGNYILECDGSNYFCNPTPVTVSSNKLALVCIVTQRAVRSYNGDNYYDLETISVSGSRVEKLMSEKSVSLEVVTTRFLTDGISNTPGVSIQGYGNKELNAVVVTGSKKVYSPAFHYSAEPVAGNINVQPNYVTDAPPLKQTTSLRNRFNDNGFWQPNMLTDKNGQATFTVQYPDNITGWQTYVLAHDAHKHTGIAYKSVQSYKNLSATLFVPQFLTEGDTAYAIGKINNYTNSPIPVTSTWMVDSQLIKQTPVKVNTVVTETEAVTAPAYSSNTDSVAVTYKVDYSNQYTDGEQRYIPVYRAGVEEVEGFFTLLNHDTTFIVSPASQMGKLTIHAETDLLPVLLEEVKLLHDYEYWCTEQTASKLIGLCLEEKINKQLGKPFKGAAEKQKLISKLEKSKVLSGGFGWWTNTPPDIYVTTHVIKALQMAGVKQNNWGTLYYAGNYLVESYPVLNIDKKLQVIETLLGFENNYKPYVTRQIENIKFDSLSVHNKMRFVKIQLQLGIDSATYWDTLLQHKKELALGGCYWGTETYNCYTNSTATSLLAYYIAGVKHNEALKQAIIQGLLSHRTPRGWRNTFESAEILAAILPDVINERGKKIEPPQLTVNRQTISNLPFTITTDGTQPVTISKQGYGLVYFSAWQRYFNTRPQPASDLFAVTTHFKRGNLTPDTLITGEVTEMIVNVQVKKYAEYVKIEVPIPAGCAYYRKDGVYGYNSYREYYKNKVAIFCNMLSPGNYTYRILLEPRYSGNYTVNPARAELMYFPTLYGQNGSRRVKINQQP